MSLKRDCWLNYSYCKVILIIVWNHRKIEKETFIKTLFLQFCFLNIVEAVLSATSKTEKSISRFWIMNLQLLFPVLHSHLLLVTWKMIMNEKLSNWRWNLIHFLPNSLLASPPENITKPKVFWRFHRGSTRSIDKKWV